MSGSTGEASGQRPEPLVPGLEQSNGHGAPTPRMIDGLRTLARIIARELVTSCAQGSGKAQIQDAENTSVDGEVAHGRHRVDGASGS